MQDFKKWLDSMEPVERGGVVTLIVILLMASMFGLGLQIGSLVGEYLL